MEEFPIIPVPPADGSYCNIHNCDTINYETSEQAPLAQPGFPASNFTQQRATEFSLPDVNTHYSNDTVELLTDLLDEKFKVNGVDHDGPLFLTGTEIFIHIQTPRVDILNNTTGIANWDDWMRTRFMNIVKDGPFESVKITVMKGVMSDPSQEYATSMGSERLAAGFLDINSGNIILRIPEFILYPSEKLFVIANIFFRNEALYLINHCEVDTDWFVNSHCCNVRTYIDTNVRAIVQVMEPEYKNPPLTEYTE